MRNIFCLLLICVTAVVGAQEFESTVTINAEQTGQPNLSIFKTLKTSLEEFVNTTKWTETEYLPQERINCNLFINVTEFNNNIFVATIQVQASRPVYGSGYQTSIANFNDKQFGFEYLEYAPLTFNPNSDQGNLVAVVAYYLYTILAIEADTFKMQGGTEYYQQAKQIVDVAQASGGAGWNASSGTQSRYRYNDDILSGNFKLYREALYNYHMKGLDLMSDNAKTAKKGILAALETLKEVNKKRANSYVVRAFFDSKATEISRLLSGGPKVDIAETVELLKNIAPSYNTDWEAIKK